MYERFTVITIFNPTDEFIPYRLTGSIGGYGTKPESWITDEKIVMYSTVFVNGFWGWWGGGKTKNNFDRDTNVFHSWRVRPQSSRSFVVYERIYVDTVPGPAAALPFLVTVLVNRGKRRAAL